jgi:hypothetical protein
VLLVRERHSAPDCLATFRHAAAEPRRHLPEVLWAPVESVARALTEWAPPEARVWRLRAEAGPAHFSHAAVFAHAAVSPAPHSVASVEQVAARPSEGPEARDGAAVPRAEAARVSEPVPQRAVRDAVVEAEVREAPHAAGLLRAALDARAVPPSAVVVWVFPPPPSARPAPRPAARFAHAMACLRVALP